MIQITDKTKCSGCTACMAACPKQCITMEADFEGFLYPVVDMDKCVNCGLCNQICPVETPLPVGKSLQESYVVRTKDKEVLKESTSGGMFTPLANLVLEHGGVVCAAAYDEEFVVKHQFLDGRNSWSDTDLAKFRGSKYVQSDVRGCFVQIKELLAQDRQVLFVGTPCQVYGLKAFLKKEYNNLLTVDFVCHGTPSPKLWEKYLQHQRNKYRAKIAKICFRSKMYGYHSGGFMQIEFENGKTYLASGRVDTMLLCFFKEVASRPICYKCPFKQRMRLSDITLYDCWNYAQLTENNDDDFGYTNVLIHSHKGKETISMLENHTVQITVSTDDAIKLNGTMMEHTPKQHPERSQFYAGMDACSLPEHVQKFLPISQKDYVIEYIKRMIYLVPALRKIRGIAKKFKK